MNLRKRIQNALAKGGQGDNVGAEPRISFSNLNITTSTSARALSRADSSAGQLGGKRSDSGSRSMRVIAEQKQEDDQTPLWMPQGATIASAECFNLLFCSMVLLLLWKERFKASMATHMLGVGTLAICLSDVACLLFFLLSPVVRTRALVAAHLINTLMIKFLALPLALHLLWLKKGDSPQGFLNAVNITWRGMHAEAFLRLYLPQLPSQIYGTYIIFRKAFLFSVCALTHVRFYGCSNSGLPQLLYDMTCHYVCSAAVLILVSCTCTTTTRGKMDEFGLYGRYFLIPKWLAAFSARVTEFIASKNPFGSGNGSVQNGLVIVASSPLVYDWSRRFMSGSEDYDLLVADLSLKFQMIFIVAFLYSLLDIRTLDERAKERHEQFVAAVLEEFVHKSGAAGDREEFVCIAGEALNKLVPSVLSICACIREPIDASNPSRTKLARLLEIYPYFAELEGFADMESSERVASTRINKDSVMLPLGMQSFKDWMAMGISELHAKRALALCAFDANTVYCTFHLYLSDETASIDQKALRRFCELYAAAALQKRTELAAKARGRVLEDLYPRHIAELLTKEAVLTERQARDGHLPSNGASGSNGSSSVQRRGSLAMPLGPGLAAAAAAATMFDKERAEGNGGVQRRGSTLDSATGDGGSSGSGGRAEPMSATTYTFSPSGHVLNEGTESPVKNNSTNSLSDEHTSGHGYRLGGSYRSTLCEIHPQATILFADIVNYTGISKSVNPEVTMMMLHSLYCEVDKIIEKSKTIEKLDVIGDSYMAISGLNYQNDEFAARNMIKFAIEMLRRVEEMPAVDFEIDGKKSVKFQVRVGINSGPCASGVLGSLRRKFTVMGESVNLSARLEQNGAPGLIHMSASTLAASGISRTASCITRRVIQVKGLGETETFLLDPYQLDLNTCTLLEVAPIVSFAPSEPDPPTAPPPPASDSFVDPRTLRPVATKPLVPVPSYHLFAHNGHTHATVAAGSVGNSPRSRSITGLSISPGLSSLGLTPAPTALPRVPPAAPPPS